jgi:hypothetical protein
MKNGVDLHLLSGEKILWRGVPSTGFILRPIEFFLVPFSLIWAGFAIFWNTGVWQTNAHLYFKLFGLPFLIAGIYVTFGRFVLDIFVRKRISYLVTDRRILIFKNKQFSSCKSLDIKRLPCLELDQNKQGRGTIKFGPSSGFSNARNFGIWSPSFDTTPQFLEIEGVRSVYELIERQSKQR